MFAILGIKTSKFILLISTLYMLQICSSSQALEICPSNCVCSPLQGSLLSAKCYQFPLLEELNDDLKLLRIDSAEVCTISEKLKKFTQLESLSISNCAIDVNVNTFTNLPHLQSVTLHNTSIDNYDPSLFELNQNLKQVNLSNNPLNIWRYVLVSASVEEVDLSNCGLKEIPQYAFSQILNLKRLILKGNELKTFDNILPNTITYLDLSNNQLENLSPQTLRSLINLHEIDISGNPLICSCKLKVVEKYLSFKSVSFIKPIECITQDEELIPLEKLSLKDVCKLKDDVSEKFLTAKLFKRVRRSSLMKNENLKELSTKISEAEPTDSTNFDIYSTTLGNVWTDEAITGDNDASITDTFREVKLNLLASSLRKIREDDDESQKNSKGKDENSDKDTGEEENYQADNESEEKDVENEPKSLNGVITILACVVVALVLLVVAIITSLVLKIISDKSAEERRDSEHNEQGDNGTECQIPMLSRRCSTRKSTSCRICPSTMSSRGSGITCRCNRSTRFSDTDTIANESQFDCSNLTSACTTFERSSRC